MPFVTRLTLESGDGNRLDDVVSDIKARAARKGVELKGPHPKPPTQLSVPLYKGLREDGVFESWDYTVYTRVIEIVGHDEFARAVTERTYPDHIHVTADIEQFSQVGDN
ncbi:MAG: uS10/mL48 family ribosomal protein [Halovenus sp.]